MTFKVPIFLSNKFSEAKTKQEKDKLVERYKNWYEQEITQELIKGLEKELEHMVQKEEERSDFVSRFQLTSSIVREKAKRTQIRKILKQLKYEV